MSDPGKYRTKEQLEADKAADPIPKHGAWLQAQGYATDAELAELDQSIKDEMKRVVEVSEAAPWPDPSLIDRYIHVAPIGR